MTAPDSPEVPEGPEVPAGSSPWKPEVEVPPDLARRLLTACAPERFDATATLVDLGVGWDNQAYLVTDRDDAEWVVRFPRRELGAALIRTELAALPRVAERLADTALAVPDPELAGRPEHGGDDYAWPFAGYRALPGRTACSVRLPSSLRSAGAATLGRFLGALHRLGRDAELAAVVPLDTIRRTDLAYRLGQLDERLDLLAGVPLPVDPAAVRARAAELATAAPWPAARPRLVHGDLYARHLLVDQLGLPSGVIDWGDLHRGDPALDLSLAWSFLRGEARRDLLLAYEAAVGERVDPATCARARFRALFYGATLVHYGREVEDEAIARVGREAFTCGMAD